MATGPNKRKRSVYWQHFQEITSGPPDSKERKAKCLHCFQILSISAGCTGNLARHLKNKHPAVTMMIHQAQGLTGDDGVMSDLNDTEVEYETEDGQKFKEVYVMSNKSEEEETEYQPRTPPKKKPKKYVPKYTDPIRTYKSYKYDDRSDIFGKLVGLKMRGLENTQRIIAEKIINDTLHEAELGNLNKYCGLSMIQIEPRISVEVDCGEKDISTNG